MTKQSTSGRENLGSDSSTSFHSSSSTISTPASEEHSPLRRTVSAEYSLTTPLVTPSNYSQSSSTYLCSTPVSNNNEQIVSTCADSLEEYTYSSTSMLGLQHGPPASPLITNHSRIKTPAISIPNESICNDFLIGESTCIQYSPCMCGELGEFIVSGNPRSVVPQLLMSSVESTNSSPRDTSKPQITFDSLMSLSSSVFQLKSYSVTCNQPPPSSPPLLHNVEGSPFLNNNNRNNECQPKESIYSYRNPFTIDKNNECRHHCSNHLPSTDTSISSHAQNDKAKSIPPLAPTPSNQDSGGMDSEIIYCHFCEKKLPTLSLSLKCKCGHYFCNKHRHAEVHNCSFDYKAEKKDFLRKNVTSVTADKVRKI